MRFCDNSLEATILKPSSSSQKISTRSTKKHRTTVIRPSTIIVCSLKARMNTTAKAAHHLASEKKLLDYLSLKLTSQEEQLLEKTDDASGGGIWGEMARRLQQLVLSAAFLSLTASAVKRRLSKVTNAIEPKKVSNPTLNPKP